MITAGKTPFPTRWKIALTAGMALAAASVAGGADAAYTAYVTSSAPLEAGPSPDYPQVAGLDAGAPVEVYGCLNGWDWCDVSFQGVRGWFDGQLLAYPYQGQRVPIFDYGVEIGLPVISFNFNEYWDAHYHDRPFFAERTRYASIPLPAPRPHEGRPAPIPHGGPGPHPAAGHGGPAPGGHPPGEHAQPQHRPPAPPHPQPQHPAPAPHPEARPAPAPHPEAKPAPKPEEEHHDEQH